MEPTPIEEKPEDKPQGKFQAVCSHCYHHNSDATIEFNFRDQAVYYVCPECKRSSNMSLKSKVAQPYPRAKFMR